MLIDFYFFFLLGLKHLFLTKARYRIFTENGGKPFSSKNICTGKSLQIGKLPDESK